MPKLTKMTPEEYQELLNKLVNEPIIKLTPKEKFDIATKHLIGRRKRFHYQVIEQGKDLYLFNGFGMEIESFDNTILGARCLRNRALELFNDSPEEKQLGGYLIKGLPNFELQTDEELELVRLQTDRLMHYNPFHVCKSCRNQFELESEFLMHRCIVGKQWIAVFI